MIPMLSIDFGNSYTKVALRTSAERSSSLFSDPALQWDDGLQVCAPTVAARYDSEGGQKWAYGTDVMRYRADSPGLTVYRNWKPQFFQTPEHPDATRPLPPPHLPPPGGMAPAQWAVIARTVSPVELPALWEALGGSNAVLPAQAVPVYRKIAVGYFKWLRNFFEPVCKKQLNRSVGEVPVRISLPSFGGVAKAEALLKDMLRDAGWRPDECAPTLPEPLANSIGIFTEGANAVNVVDGESFPHLGIMFAKTGLLEKIREASLRGGPTTSWVLIADIGGYTTDFAMLGLDLTDVSASLEGELEGVPRLEHTSTPLGVANLDEAVVAVLPTPKKAALEVLIRAPDQAQLEAFHRNIYRDSRRYAVTSKLALGSTATEMASIRAEIERFAERSADDAERFLSIHQYSKVDELILTGGGTLIPAVQQALITRLSGYGLRMVHLDKSAEPRWANPRIKPHYISKELTRGATAFGGASVYFDYSER